MFIKHEFIGVSQLVGDQVRYGWIKCHIDMMKGQYEFQEYAIDTSAINYGFVRVGRRYKSL
jgi:hypothetical protein